MSPDGLDDSLVSKYDHADNVGADADQLLQEATAQMEVKRGNTQEEKE